MSFDEGFLVELVEALAQSGIQVVFIGNAAAILHGAAVLTHDVDLMVRDHPQLQAKLEQFARSFGVALTKPYEPLSQVIRATGRQVNVDFVLNLSSRKSFESIRSRASKVRIGQRMVWVASLEDVIAAAIYADLLDRSGVGEILDGVSPAMRGAILSDWRSLIAHILEDRS